jgi:hypothetical protein
MENMHFLDISTPIYGDDKDVIPPYVGCGHMDGLLVKIAFTLHRWVLR